MIVVRMLLNSWATLEASAPTLLSRWAWSSCCRSWSASTFGASTPPLVMNSASAALAGVARREQAQHPPLAIGIGCAGAPSSSKGTFDEKPME